MSTEPAGVEPTNIELVPLDAEARSSLSALAYREWFQAFDKITELRHQHKNGWTKLQSEHLTTAVADFIKATRVLDQIKSWSPLILGR